MLISGIHVDFYKCISVSNVSLISNCFLFINKPDKEREILLREFLSLLPCTVPHRSITRSPILAQAVFSRMHLHILNLAVLSKIHLPILAQAVFSKIYLSILDMILLLPQPQVHLRAPFTIIRYGKPSIEVTLYLLALSFH